MSRTDLPTGTVTFFFSDIEGSTRLLQRIGQAYRDVLHRHNEIVREALATHGGVEIQTEGDSFFAAFATAPSAVDASAAIQQRLAAADWSRGGVVKIRIGLHTGLGELGGDSYLGLDVHRAARISDAAHGGQVVASASTKALAAGRDFIDLGSHRLKDLEEPEYLYQVIVPNVPHSFPPLRTLDTQAGSPDGNLPVQLASFVGRRSELDDLSAKLASTRLLTLTGAGGAGKTRLALQLATQHLGSFKHGAWFVDLAPAVNREMALSAVATSLGVPAPTYDSVDASAETGVGAIVDHVESWTALVILDNCEHLVAAAAESADALLHRCPHLKVLATSRERLGTTGESVWRVPPLGLPATGDSLLDSDCVQLFLARAEATGTDAVLSGAELEAVAEICRRLDGIPLAVELAAARCSLLSPTEIAQRLGDSLGLLAGSARTALPRHQTLQATIAWSYDLLSPLEQTVFRRLSVFQGGFTLDMAETVLASDAVDSDRVLDLVASLVAKSIVIRDSARRRFGMLETIRQFGLEILSADEDASVRRRHLDAFLEMARDMDLRMISAEEPKARLWFTSELPNIRSAITFGLEHDLAPSAIALLNATAWYLQASGKPDVLAEAGKLASGHTEDVDPALGAMLFANISFGLAAIGESQEAAPYAQRERTLAEQLDDPGLLTAAGFADYVGCSRLREDARDCRGRRFSRRALPPLLARNGTSPGRPPAARIAESGGSRSRRSESGRGVP